MEAKLLKSRFAFCPHIYHLLNTLSNCWTSQPLKSIKRNMKVSWYPSFSDMQEISPILIPANYFSDPTSSPTKRTRKTCLKKRRKCSVHF